LRESKLQDACVKVLKERGIYYINVYGSGRTAKGAPDLIACVNGRFVGFELKVGNNEMQADQIIHMRRIKRSGGLHYVPRTVEEFRNILEDIENEREEKNKG
jgi:Holliday junction resolvase